MLLRLYFFIGRYRPGIFYRLNRRQRRVRDILNEQVVPTLAASRPDHDALASYPWCFVIADGSRGHFAAGAFRLLRAGADRSALMVIYGDASYSWLEKNMAAEYPLTFWASRILNGVSDGDIAEKNWRPHRRWLSALRWACSPLLQRVVLQPALHFNRHSYALLREGSQQDYRIRSSDGVESMPWNNWPACLREESGVWIWRQSRHRKILDSQRIPLRRAGAQPPDASF